MKSAADQFELKIVQRVRGLSAANPSMTIHETAGLLEVDGLQQFAVRKQFRAGDLGWMLWRHGRFYAEEHGFDRAFERLVAEIVAEFLARFDPEREACWIAEIDGEPVGSIMLVDAGDHIAKLRLLLVESRARGHGIGRRLVEECVRFAREAGYRRITLWTQSTLIEARAIYQRVGFAKVAEKAHRDFGVDLIGEVWEMEL